MKSDTNSLLNKLNQIVERLPAEYQPQVWQNLTKLLSAGGKSLEGIIEVSHCDDAQMRMFACWILGQLQEKRAASPLLSVFRDKNLDVATRSQAAVSLSMLGSKRPVKPLISAIQRDEEDFVKEYAVYVLGLLNDDRAVQPLIEILKNKDMSTKLRAQAAESLGHLGLFRASTATPMLVVALQDAAPEVRYWVAFALGELGDQDALHVLEHHAKNDTVAIPEWGPIAEEAQEAIELIKAREAAKAKAIQV